MNTLSSYLQRVIIGFVHSSLLPESPTHVQYHTTKQHYKCKCIGYALVCRDWFEWVSIMHSVLLTDPKYTTHSPQYSLMRWRPNYPYTTASISPATIDMEETTPYTYLNNLNTKYTNYYSQQHLVNTLQQQKLILNNNRNIVLSNITKLTVSVLSKSDLDWITAVCDGISQPLDTLVYIGSTFGSPGDLLPNLGHPRKLKVITDGGLLFTDMITDHCDNIESLTVVGYTSNQTQCIFIFDTLYRALVSSRSYSNGTIEKVSLIISQPNNISDQQRVKFSNGVKSLKKLFIDIPRTSSTNNIEWIKPNITDIGVTPIQFTKQTMTSLDKLCIRSMILEIDHTTPIKKEELLEGCSGINTTKLRELIVKPLNQYLNTPPDPYTPMILNRLLNNNTVNTNNNNSISNSITKLTIQGITSDFSFLDNLPQLKHLTIVAEISRGPLQQLMPYISRHPNLCTLEYQHVIMELDIPFLDSILSTCKLYSFEAFFKNIIVYKLPDALIGKYNIVRMPNYTLQRNKISQIISFCN